MKKKNFISVGECMVELQSATNGLYRLGFAGDTLNTAWYVRALTKDKNVAVDYLTAIGTDQLSQSMKLFLEDNGIGTSLIQKIPDRTVGLYLITLAKTERSFTYWRDQSAAKLLANNESTLRSALSNTDYIYFSGITLAILNPERREFFLSVLRDMKLAGATIAFDPNFRRKLWSSDDEMMSATIKGYEVASLALPTFTDEQSVFNDKSPSDCAKRIADYGASETIVKDGPNPSLALVDGEIIIVAPDIVEGIVDTTGAGDSFNAGYIAARLANHNFADAMKIAHRVAAQVICERGALLAMSGFSDLIPR